MTTQHNRTRKSKLFAIFAAAAVIVGLFAGFSYYSWKFGGLTWMLSPPNSVHMYDKRLYKTADSPIPPFGGLPCIPFDSMPITGKTICAIQESLDDRRYLFIEWNPGEFYKYYDFGPEG